MYRLFLTVVIAFCSVWAVADENANVRTQEQFDKELNEFIEKSREYISKKDKSRVEITNLYDGDSLALLNESQYEMLDYALNLLVANDSVVELPLVFNTMMQDARKEKYVGYTDFKSAYFINDINLRIPVYTETTHGVINSFFIVNKKDGKYTHQVYTQMPINTIYKGTSLMSHVDGEFLWGNVYRNGKYEGKKTYKKNKNKDRKQKYHERKKKYAYEPYEPNKEGVYKNSYGPYSEMDYIRNQDLPVLPKQGN